MSTQTSVRGSVPSGPVPAPPLAEQPRSTDVPTAENAPAMAVTNARDDEKERRIAELAYQIAEQHGFPTGMELEHWLEAERRVARS